MINSPWVIDTTEDNFEQVVIEKSKEIPVIVDFWAGWCGPCKMLMPILVKLADEYDGKFQVAKINTDEQRELSIAHGIRSLPTLRIYVDGNVREELIGMKPESILREIIDQYI